MLKISTSFLCSFMEFLSKLHWICHFLASQPIMASSEEDEAFYRRLVDDFYNDEQIYVWRFISSVRQVMQRTGSDDIEATSDHLLEKCLQLGGDGDGECFNTLTVGYSASPFLEDSTDERIFDVLASHPHFTTIFIGTPFHEESLQGFFDRGIPKMVNVKSINTFANNNMPGNHATKFLTIFCHELPCGELDIGLHDLDLEDTCTLEALESFVRRSTQLKHLTIGPLEKSTPSRGLLPRQFDSLCRAIADCPSPHFAMLLFGNDIVRRDAVEEGAKSLADMLAKKRPVIHTIFTGVVDGLTTDHISRLLSQSDAAANFDVCFRTVTLPPDNDRESTSFYLLMGPSSKFPFPWKGVLGDDTIPLTYWPYILEKASKWNKATSHSSLDAFYFLVKEKPDILLQNVKRRRIRKRKRFQLDG